MVGLIVMEANHNNLGAVPIHVARVSITETSLNHRSTSPTVWLSAMDLTLLASVVGIRGVGPLHLVHCCLHLLLLELQPKL